MVTKNFYPDGRHSLLFLFELAKRTKLTAESGARKCKQELLSEMRVVP